MICSLRSRMLYILSAILLLLRCNTYKMSGSSGREKIRYVPRVIELFQPVLEHLLFLVLVNKGVSFAETVELVDHAFEELFCHASSANAGGIIDIGWVRRTDAILV